MYILPSPIHDFKVMPCTHCLHPTCPYSLTSTVVGRCPQETCPQGQLVFYPGPGPKWKIACNVCTKFLVHIVGSK